MIKQFTNYKIHFNTQLQVPNYSVYYLETRVKRAKCKFYTDDEIKTRNQKEFTRSNLSRGHLTPAIDVENSKETFHMANIVPQFKNYNCGIWNRVEDYVRKNFMFHTILTIAEYEKDFIPIGFYKVVIKQDVVWSLYLKHEDKISNSCFKKEGIQKLPDLIKL